MTNHSLRALAETYAAAKCRQDVAAALAVCHDGFVLDTPCFGTRSVGRDETALQLQLFFAAFPDYHATLDGVVEQGDTLACWGDVVMTFAGPILDIAPTGRTARVPFVSIFTARDGRLGSERFFFDLATLCAQLGVPTERLRGTLAMLQPLSAAQEATA